VVRLGEPLRVVTEPGLNFKIPLLDGVIDIDKRILDHENPAQEVVASDQKRLVVDAFRATELHLAECILDINVRRHICRNPQRTIAHDRSLRRRISHSPNPGCGWLPQLV
jgi:SPFH domain / Band 7 family